MAAHSVKHRPASTSELLSCLGCAILPHSAVYVAVPITGGQVFIHWYSSCGRNLLPAGSSYREGLKQCVVIPNISVASHKVEMLRSLYPTRPLINPAVLDVAGWKQPDYQAFWVEVLEKFVGHLVFLNGWHLSQGCVLEYTTAVRLGLSVATEDGSPLELTYGLQMIQEGMHQYKQIGIDSVVLDEASSYICGLVAKGA